MEIILKITVPDEDVTTATENTIGSDGDLAEWITDFFASNDRDYLTSLGLEQMTIEILGLH